VVFAGYGFDIDQDSLKWKDYNGVDVKGKWVMIFRGDPELDNTESKFIPYGDNKGKSPDGKGSWRCRGFTGHSKGHR